MYLFGKDNSGFSIHSIYDSLLEKYDKEMADIVFDMYFEHYYHVDIIDNGLYGCCDLDFVPGSNILLEKLVSGKWDSQFLVVPPRTNITQGIFF